MLVPLRAHEGAPGSLEVILTRRAASLSHHSGQVAFPGGLIEAPDETPEAAALREAHEELAIEPTHVDVVGRLDDLVTGTGFHIAPVVGVVGSAASLVPNAAEVARVFAVPLDDLVQLERWVRRPHTYGGATFELWHYLFDGEDVWGATGAVLRGMVELLRRSP